MTTPRLIPLREWAKIVFGEHAPHANTLLKWVQDGRIHPLPRKLGKQWFVPPNADYVGD